MRFGGIFLGSGLRDFHWVGLGGGGGFGEVEGGLGVGVGGVEVGDVGGEVFGEGQVGLADSLDDAAGQFVGSVVVEVGVVVDGVGLVGVGVGGVVHEGVGGGFGAEGFEEGLRHGVEVDEGDVLLGGDLADGFGVVAEGVGDVTGGVEGVAMHGGDEDGCGSGGAGPGDVLGEEALVLVYRNYGLVRLGVDLLVVVVELHEEVVAGLDEGEDLGEALLGDEGFDGLAGLGVVGYDDAGDEEAWEHLAPCGPGFDVLVDYGGVPGEVDGGFVA